MRIFLTGATGFIGTALIPELLQAGHQVLGLTRSDEGAQALQAAGVEPHRGNIEDLDSLRRGAEQTDGILHCGFNHDFSNFMQNCENDKRAIEAMGEVLQGSNRPIVITSGTGMGASTPGKPATEDVFDSNNPNPRKISEIAGAAIAERGVNVSIMRLPQVHDTHKQGLITPCIMMAVQHGVSAYVGEGQNVWPAAHVSDVARLYRIAFERAQPGSRYNAVAEEGIAMKDIAEAIGRGLNIPIKSLTPEQAMVHFGHFGPFAAMDLPASSALTRQRTGWTPTGPDLLTDLNNMDYAAFIA